MAGVTQVRRTLPLFLFFFYIIRKPAKGSSEREKKRPFQIAGSLRRTDHKRSLIFREQVSCHSSLEGIQVVGTKKYRLRKTVPEFTSRKKEKLSILVNSCSRGLDKHRVRLSRLSSTKRTVERGRHAVSKFRRTVFITSDRRQQEKQHCGEGQEMEDSQLEEDN